MVVALGGAPVELVVATDMSLQFLQVTNEPRFLFRVREKIALRIKEADAIVTLRLEVVRTRVRHARLRVIILGGGVAGMSAAHELIERGFEVVVLERGDIAGGKARSIPVIDEGEDTSGHQLAERRRAFASSTGCPASMGSGSSRASTSTSIDTMRRIPSFDGRKVADHLVPTTRLAFTQYDEAHIRRTGGLSAARPAMPAPCCGTSCWRSHRSPTSRPTIWHSSARASGRSSPRARSAGSGSTSGRAGGTSSAPRSGRRPTRSSSPTGITRSLVAAKARKASTRTIGDIFVQLVLTILNPIAGSTDRVLDGPTNLVWIDPWLTYLESRGVQYVKNAEVEEILCESGRITGVVAQPAREAHRGARRPLRGRAARSRTWPPW